MDGIIRQTIETFFDRRVQSHLAELEQSPHLLPKLYVELEELGLFSLHPSEDIRTICDVLRTVSAVDSGIATAILAHYVGKTLLQSNEPANLRLSSPIYRRFEELTPEFYDSKFPKAPLVSGWTNAIVLPVWRKDFVNVLELPVESSTMLDTIGSRTAPISQIKLNPESSSLEVGRIDIPTFMNFNARFQVAAASLAFGMMQGSLAAASKYCSERKQGGKRIIEWSQVKYDLSQLQIELCSIEAMMQYANSNLEWNRTPHLLIALSIKILDQLVPLVTNA